MTLPAKSPDPVWITYLQAPDSVASANRSQATLDLPIDGGATLHLRLDALRTELLTTADLVAALRQAADRLAAATPHRFRRTGPAVVSEAREVILAGFERVG